MENDNHVVVSHKLCGFQGCVGSRVVMMKNPVVVAPKFWSFSLYIFSQLSQNVTVKVRLDHSVRRNKFTVKKPVSMLFVYSGSAAPFLLLVIVDSSTATITALFRDHNRKSNFHHPLRS
jgi:hypothetical protein